MWGDLHLPYVLVVEFENPQLPIGLIGNLQGVRKYHHVASMAPSLYLKGTVVAIEEHLIFLRDAQV